MLSWTLFRRKARLELLKTIGFIFLGLLLLLLILLLLPAHARARYDGTLQVWAGFGPVDLRILPPKTKKKKPEKTTKKKKEKPAKKRKKPALDEMFSYARLALDALGKLKRRLVIRHLELVLDVGGKDAGTAALTYGHVAAGVSALYPVLQRNLRIRKTDIRVDAAFDQKEIGILADVAVAACPLRMLFAALLILIAFLKLRLKYRQKTVSMNSTEKGGTPDEQYQ